MREALGFSGSEPGATCLRGAVGCRSEEAVCSQLERPRCEICEEDARGAVRGAEGVQAAYAAVGADAGPRAGAGRPASVPGS